MVEKSDARYKLGLSFVGQKKPTEAAAVFRTLLNEDPKYAVADKVYYELAWALKSAGKEKESVEAFAELIKQCPESPYVAEGQFCVGEAAYKEGKYQAAATAYAAAMDKAGKSDLGEKAAHKLGWACFRQAEKGSDLFSPKSPQGPERAAGENGSDPFSTARQAFAYQRATWPKGPLAADAAFMEAECLFKQKKYSDAAAAFEHVKETSSIDFQVLSLLHGAQAQDAQALAMLRPDQEKQRTETWQKGLALVERLIKENPETRVFARCLVRARLGLAESRPLGRRHGRLSTGAGRQAKSKDKSNAEPAARPQFMIGQIQFQQKKYADAVTSFYLVLYEYPYPQWQADAAFEAARCFEALHKRSQAVKQYQELIEKFPQSDKVSAAKSRLESLQKD